MDSEKLVDKPNGVSLGIYYYDYTKWWKKYCAKKYYSIQIEKCEK